MISSPSGLPPAGEAEITWSTSHYVAVIHSPRALLVKLWLPVWSNHSRRQVQVNGRYVALHPSAESLGHWTGRFPGGDHKVVILVTDAE